jgi:hypothetical protein
MKARFIVKSLVGGVPSLKRERRQHTKVPGIWYANGTLKAHQHTKRMKHPPARVWAVWMVAKLGSIKMIPPEGSKQSDTYTMEKKR